MNLSCSDEEDDPQMTVDDANDAELTPVSNATTLLQLQQSINNLLGIQLRRPDQYYFAKSKPTGRWVRIRRERAAGPWMRI